MLADFAAIASIFRLERPADTGARTELLANVGGDKDSDKRQREAIEVYAKRSGFEPVWEFYDAAVSGADPIQGRPGFAGLHDRIEGNGVRTVIGLGSQALGSLRGYPSSD